MLYCRGYDSDDLEQITALPTDALNFDPFSQAFIDDPYPVFAGLRAESPVFWHNERMFWVVTGYDEVESALHNYAVFSSEIPSAGELDPIIDKPAMLLCDDPPRHTFLKDLVKTAFAPKQISTLEDSIQLTADDLLEKMGQRFAAVGVADCVAGLASPLAVTTIAQILGVPLSLRPLQDWAFSTAIPSRLADDENVRATMRRKLIATMLEIAEQGGQGAFKCIAQQSSEDALSTGELARLSFILWISAIEAPTFLITNGIFLLERSPALKRTLTQDQSLVADFIEELLRYDAPVIGLFRRAKTDTELGGKKIKQGDRVWLFFAAANRDSKYFHDPDVFDMSRFGEGNRSALKKPHLSFGSGIHGCLGSNLARMQAKIAFTSLLRRFPTIRANIKAGHRTSHPVMRGFHRLPMTLGDSSS